MGKYYQQKNKGKQYSNYSKKNEEKKEENYKFQDIPPYVGAPYNFVSFSNNVYEYEKSVTAHNSMEEDLQTGEITYEITAKTPIIVDDGKGNFCKNAKGEYAIPGSTIRGLIRNNVQILGLASFNDDIDDYALMYRNVAGGKDKINYGNILGADTIPISDGKKKYSVGVLKNVKAGYVEKKGETYIIHKTCIDTIRDDFKEMNYYVLSERKIINDYLKSQEKGTTFDYNFFVRDGKSIMQHELAPFRKDNKANTYKGIQRKEKDYKPYYEEISYKISGDRDIIAVGMSGEYELKGYVMSTGKMNNKKAIYIIPEIDNTKEPIEIPEKDVKAFQIDLKKRENTLKRFGGKEFFDLPQKEGEIKPIFYVELKGRFYFGFTPRLRLFYDYTIKHGMNENHEPHIIDYSKALFGYSNPNNCYKSRVSFSDAKLFPGRKTEEKRKLVLEERKLILAEPKPTSYMDYLKAFKGRAVTYNNKQFELRGVKQYWLHKEVISMKIGKDKEAVATTIRPLCEKVKFKGKVRFQNLTKDELGLLLWSIQLNENSSMNVGKAKSYGYGRILLKITEAKVVDKTKAYKLDSLDLEPFTDIEIEEMIDIYKDKMKKYLGGKEIDELPHIKEFFYMKEATLIPEKEKIRYMSIERKIEGRDKKVNEYQNRKKVLPSIEEVVEKENGN